MQLVMIWLLVGYLLLNECVITLYYELVPQQMIQRLPILNNLAAHQPAQELLFMPHFWEHDGKILGRVSIFCHKFYLAKKFHEILHVLRNRKHVTFCFVSENQKSKRCFLRII
jgi:hypothetical protein